VTPSQVTLSVSSIPLCERDGGAEVGSVELERQRVEALEREVVIGLLPRLVQPALDGVGVSLGDGASGISLLVPARSAA
jgi:hypothetical protein